MWQNVFLQIHMPGFLGTSSVSFEMPDSRGIAKSVSRGFRTVVKTESENSLLRSAPIVKTIKHEGVET